MLYQQGDVLIQSVDKVPSGAKKAEMKGGKYILAEGEVTGHCHAVSSKDAVIQLDGNNMFLSVLNSKGATVVHPEHGKVKVPAGNYTVRKVREYDHFAEEAKAVAD